jgi:hypothetical protein
MLKSGDTTSVSAKKNGVSEVVSRFFCIFAANIKDNGL